MGFSKHYCISNIIEYRHQVGNADGVGIVRTKTFELLIITVHQIGIHLLRSDFPPIEYLPLTFAGRTQINTPITVIDFIMKVTWTN